MEIETLVTMDKASKSTIDQARGYRDGGDITKKTRSQDLEEEREDFVTKLVETGPDQLGFQVYLRGSTSRCNLIFY